MAETITLSGVPETMLQTVYARAKESRGRGAIRDLKAEEIIGRLDYDFSLADKDAAMHSGVIARTIVLDRLVGEYLAAHPGATVMNLACGLDTRCYRMQGCAYWYNLDLPETIAVREALLPESGSISQLAMSAMDDWGAAVEGPSGPALVIIEGLTMYLTQAAALNAAFDARLQALRADNAAAGKEKQFHLENQILPGIAAYETLQTVMPKEEALQTVHGYVEQRAWKLRKLFFALMRRHGFFIHASSNLKSIGSTEGTCNKEGLTPGSSIKPYYTGSTRHQNYTFTAGAIHHITHGFCLFEGVGYGKAATAWQQTESSGGGYLLNEDLTHKGFTAQLGVLASFNRVSIAASAITIAGKQWQGSIGIGIKIGKQKK